MGSDRNPRGSSDFSVKRMLMSGVASFAVAIAAAGCGGDKQAGRPPAGGTATVAVKDSGLGKILVDGSGRTLYLFLKDQGKTSTCLDACADVWPPMTVSGTPKAGAGASASELGTTSRKDGGTEVTYHGHPLYYYEADNAPGDTAGQGLDQFGAEWYVLSPDGDKLEKDGS